MAVGTKKIKLGILFFIIGFAIFFKTVLAMETGDGFASQKVLQQEVNRQEVLQENAEQKNSALETLRADYEAYRERFGSILYIEDIEANGFAIIEEHSFPVMMESFGSKELTFLPAMDKEYQRLAVFLADAEGNICFKTEQLETNYRNPGALEQPTESIASVAFQDINGDALTDIILLTRCVNSTGQYAGMTYKVGDVLFQGDKNLYRDWRISDKINRFSMNKSANCIISFVRDGNSTEILYTATTLEELLENGFSIIAEQCYARDFEKLGRLRVVPGTIKVSEYDFFMVYLVNEQGQIVWSFQPMGDYDNLYSLKGINGRDLDGDGMKDLVVLAKYSKEDENGEMLVETQCAIYYQRTSGFDVDTEFLDYYKKQFAYVEDTVEHGDENSITGLEEFDDKIARMDITMEELVTKIREYWGWKVEND